MKHAEGTDDRAEQSLRRADLMARLQGGDAEACRALLNDIGPSVRAFLRRRIAGAEDLDDVYQEVLLGLYEARHSYQPGRPLEPWLFAIARNIAIDYSRRRWSRARWEELSAEPPEAIAETSPEPQPDLQEALASLPKVQREAFTMLKLDGLSLDHAAARAGTSVGAMKLRAHRAYKALRDLIGGGK